MHCATDSAAGIAERGGTLSFSLAGSHANLDNHYRQQAHMNPDHLFAPTGLGVTVASGDQTTLYGLSTYWDSVCTCAPLADRGLDLRIYAQVAYWRGTERPSDHQSLWEGSVTPALRWMGPAVGAATLFTDLGLGVSLISQTRINRDRQFATTFQFNEHFGVGLAFGEKRRYEVAAYVRHVSNGSIKQQNDGETFFGGVFRVALD
jgi:Lipid A 3-O-deacylase (PagL)